MSIDGAAAERSPRLRFEIFHYQEVNVAGLFRVKRGHDVGVGQPGRRFDLAACANHWQPVDKGAVPAASFSNRTHIFVVALVQRLIG